jgi:hypothetical protein
MSNAATRARRDQAREHGICRDCFDRPVDRKPDGSPYTACAECRDVNRKRCAKQTALVAYVPLDETMRRPSFRILRALRWYDGISCEDLLDALDVDAHRGRFTRSFSWLHAKGYVRGAAWDLYTITDAGRAWIAEMIAHADNGIATDAEAA